MGENLCDLQGRVAIVTGAAGQLGGQYVKALIEAGASVAALDINLANPKSQLGWIGAQRLLTLEADITKRDSIRKALDLTVSELGVPSILVNNAALDAPPNAGDQETGPFESYPETSWQAMVDVNLTGMLICCQVFGGHMAENGRGSIINIASVYGMLSPDQRIYEYRAETKPFIKPVSYCVTKAGVLNLTRYLATYWAGKGVRVNTLTLAGVYNHQDETFVANYSAKVPMARMAREDEFNGAILFLASDASSYMTGSNLVIDGGYSCW